MTIEKLEALEKAATAGPWAEWIGNTSVHFGVRIDTNVPWMLSGADGVVCKCDNMDSECKRQAVQDAAFIASARNAMPSLLAVAKAAQKSLDQLSYILEVAHNEQQDNVLYPNMLAEIGTRREELREALYRLEAQ